MNYLPRNKAKSSHWKKALILALLFGLGALLFSFFGGFIVSAISPIWRAENAVSRALSRSFEYWHSKQVLIDENVSLRNKVTALALERDALALSLSEGHSLSELLGRKHQEGEVIASVLTRPPQSPYDLFIIDAGTKEGLATGSRVSLPGGAVVGIVSDIFPSSAKVKLFTTPGEKTEAVLERGNIPVILVGRGSGNFRVTVPRETVVVVGDRIVSADVHYSLLGVVEDVEVTATDSFKEILARSPANIFAVRLVSASP